MSLVSFATRVIVFFVSVLLFFEASDAFARGAFRAKTFHKNCVLVRNEKCVANIILPSCASEDEIAVAKFLEYSLKKIASRADVSVGDASKKNLNIALKRVGEISTDIKAPLNIRVVFKNRKIEIIYPSSSDAWTAVGIFLDEFCKVRFYAPNKIGEEFPQYKYLAFELGEKIFNIPFTGRRLGINQRDSKTFEQINGRDNKFAIPPHNISSLFKGEVLKPDWFASFNGIKYVNNFAQPDFFNEDFRSFAAEKVISHFQKNAKVSIFSLGYSDNSRFDTSRKSLSFSRGYTARDYTDFSNIIFDFTNDIARRLARKYPDKYVTQLAYLRTENPPDFKLEKNVAVVLCTDKGNWYSDKQRQIDKKLISDWGKSGAGVLGVHDYNYGSSHFIPREISEYIAESIKDYARAGFSFYYAETSPIWAYDAHKIWIAFKLLKEPSLNYKELREDFFRNYYKEASEHVCRFFDIARAAWRCRSDLPALWLKLYKRPSQFEIFSDVDIAYMDSSLAMVEKSAKSEIVVARVKEIRLVFELSKTYRRIYFYQKALWNLSPTRENANEILKNIEALKIARFLANAQMNIYRNSTRYPKANFADWNLMHMLNPSNMRATELLALEDEKISSEVERLFGKEFCANAKLANLAKGKNLLKNSSFEKGLDSWLCARSVTCKESFELSHTAARSGKYRFMLASTSFAAIAQRVDVKSGALYKYQVFAKGKVDLGATYYARLKFFGKNKSGKGVVLKTQFLQIPSGDFKEFKKFEIISRAPDGAYSAECAFVSVNSASVYPISLDDFSFVEMSE